MDLQLLAFVAVAEERNFTRAAARLHTTQPAVSQQIAQLERRLNVRLLERTNKVVRLNQAGEVVLHYAREMIRQYEQMVRLVEDMVNEVRGPLRIGASFTYGEYLLPRVVAAFLQQYPEVTPIVAIENTRAVIAKVATGALDLGVVESAFSDDGVDAQTIMEDTMVVVAAASHPLAGSSTVSMSQLANSTWVVREEGSGTRAVTEALWAARGVLPAAVVEFGSTQAVKESVAAGLGVSLLSTAAVAREIALAELVQLPLDGDIVHRPFLLVTQKTAFRPKVARNFAQFLRLHP